MGAYTDVTLNCAALIYLFETVTTWVRKTNGMSFYSLFVRSSSSFEASDDAAWALERTSDVTSDVDDVIADVTANDDDAIKLSGSNP